VRSRIEYSVIIRFQSVTALWQVRIARLSFQLGHQASFKEINLEDKVLVGTTKAALSYHT
jgi:hypothetical protein